MKKVVVVLANGFEEIEAITPIDIFRRAGLEVTVAGVGSTLITGSHGIPVTCDIEVSDANEKYSCIVLPGGMPGALNLIKSKVVQKLIYEVNKEGLVCAICASPAVVLAPLGLLEARVAVCYPGMESYAPTTSFANGYVVVQDDHVITASGPGCASDFSFMILEELLGSEIVKKLKHDMIYISKLG